MGIHPGERFGSKTSYGVVGDVKKQNSYNTDLDYAKEGPRSLYQTPQCREYQYDGFWEEKKGGWNIDETKKSKHWRQYWVWVGSEMAQRIPWASALGTLEGKEQMHRGENKDDVEHLYKSKGFGQGMSKTLTKQKKNKATTQTRISGGSHKT